MAIWSAEIKELEQLYESIKGQLPDLEKELGHLIKAEDENVVLLYSRRCLEVIITDLCECQLKRERGTEPLKGIIDKLNKDKKVPSHIITSMHGLNDLSTYGTHPKDFDPEQVKPVLVNLDIIIKWYLKYKQIVTIDKTVVDEEKIRLRKLPLEEVTIKERTEMQEKPAKAGKRKLLSIVAISAIIAIAAILAYPKIFKRDTLEKLRSSGGRICVAVMPFQNMTGDTTWNIRQAWIQDILINSLSNSEELRIRQAENINNLVKNQGIVDYASISQLVASTIAQKLDANVFIYGNIKQAGNILRLYAQLIDTKSEDVIKPFLIEGNNKEEKIFQLIDSLSTEIKNFLIISKLKQEHSHESPTLVTTNSPEAFRCFLNGTDSFYNQDYPSARSMFFQALAIDSNINIALTYISTSYWNEGSYDQAKKWCLKAYKKREQMPMIMNLLTSWLFANNFKTPHEEITFLRDILDIDDQLPTIYFLLGNVYSGLYQYDKAISEYEKSLEICKKWDLKPHWILSYTYLGRAYHKTGKYYKEKEVYKEAEKNFPDEPALIYKQAVLALSEGDVRKGNEYIEKFISSSKESSASQLEIASNISENFSTEAAIARNMAEIYSEANILDKGEKYYRQALSLEPDNPGRLNNLAWFLINKNRNINEGLELVGKALELSPDNYNYLHTKGWGLYKQGKYQEAYEILQKSWDLRRQYAIYDHDAFLHLEAVKKAVAEQKNN